MSLGKLLISAGLVLVVLGLLVVVISRSGLPIGRLPGDIAWRGKNTTFYFPWVTCLLLSLLASLLLWFFNRRN
jgi:ribose/xylose/arabinose/galactoside ABC-type transport system permease subunit